MAAEWKEHVVRITYQRSDGTVAASSGYALSPRRVLTALHVAFDQEGTQRPELRVGLAELELRHARPAACCWPEAYVLASPDVAVLSLDEDLPLSDATTLQLRARCPAQGERWSTYGFPSVVEPARADPAREPESASGPAEEPPRGPSPLELNATTGPRYWNGLSGAPVVCSGAILGVVQSTNEGWSNKLYATPLSATMGLPGFLEACGQAQPEDDTRVREVEERTRARLSGRTALRRSLATSLDLPDSAPPDALARRLLREARAVDIVRAIIGVDEDLSGREGHGWAEDRVVVRDLLWLVLPLAVDWRAHRRTIQAALERNESILELPFFTGTVVECILAGVERREARPVLRFDSHGNRYTAGPGAVQQPPALCCPDILGDLLVERVAQDLAPKLGCSHVADPKERLKQVAKGVRLMAVAPRSRRLRYYFLFVDIHQKGDAASCWDVAKDALTTDIPFLRLIRLTGTTDTSPDEQEIALYINMILESATPKELGTT